MKKSLAKKLALVLALCMVMLLIGACAGETTVQTQPTAAPVATAAAPATTQAGTQATTDFLPDDADYQDIYAFIQAKSDNPDKVIIRYASQASEETLYAQPYTRGFVMFLKWLKEAMGDKIEVTFILNAAIGGTADAVLGALQLGNIELTDYTTTSCGEFSKAFMPLDLFYMVKSFDEMAALLDGPAGDLMTQKFLEDTNLRIIDFGILGPRQMTNNVRAIESVADMKGLKMRVQSNKMHMLCMEALGPSATNIAFSELFTALQQNTIDGQENPADTILNHNYFEVQKYLAVTNHLVAVAGMIVNNDWYEGLDDEMKAAIADCAARADEYGRTAWHAENDAVLAELEGKMTVTYLSDETLSEFQAAAKTAWPSCIEVIGEDYFNEFLETAGITLE